MNRVTSPSWWEPLLLSTSGRAELRARHTCIRVASSMQCAACNQGIPYPAMTLDELLGSLSLGTVAERSGAAAEVTAAITRGSQPLPHRCPKCGFDASIRVIDSFEFLIARDVPSLNKRISNTRSGAYKYRPIRDAWCLELRAKRLAHKIPFARPLLEIAGVPTPAIAGLSTSSWPIVTGKRRITIVRRYGGRSKRRDHDNFVGGCKSLVDAMFLECLIKDDTDQHVEIHYQQIKTDDRHGMHFTLEILA